MSRSLSFSLRLSLGILVFLTGCMAGEEFGSVEIPGGTIAVRLVPASLNAPWTLMTSDRTINGRGDGTLTGMSPGEYILTWDAVGGWIKPASKVKSLEYEGSISFNGIYVTDPGPTPGFVSLPPDSVFMPTTFTMGSLVADNETPHQVTLTHRFEMAATEMSNARFVELLQWAYDNGLVTMSPRGVRDAMDGATVEILDPDDPDVPISFTDGIFSTSSPDRPVVGLNWFGAAACCDWLSLQSGLPRTYDHDTWQINAASPYGAPGFRLPTEAEWEFACRAATTTHFNTGDCLDPTLHANFDGTIPFETCPSGQYPGQTSNVASFSPNDWGLYDLHGNVWEWCGDWYDFDFASDVTDPPGEPTGFFRIIRGGAWNFDADYCRSANRYSNMPGTRNDCIGFRPVRSLD